MSTSKPYRISLEDLPRKLPFSVPEGYFDQFESALDQRRAVESGQELSPAWDHTLPFTVPEGYFQQLPTDIMLRVHGEFKEDTPRLIDSALPFHVPEGYFKELPEIIQAKAGASFQNNTLSVPEGFFEQLHSDIQKRIQGEQETKVIPLYKKPGVYWGALGSMAAAIAFLLLFNNSGVSNENCVELACLDLSQTEIEDYIESEVILQEDLYDEIEVLDAASTEIENFEFLESETTGSTDQITEEVLILTPEVSAPEPTLPPEENLKDPVDQVDEWLEDLDITEEDLDALDLDFEIL